MKLQNGHLSIKFKDGKAYMNLIGPTDILGGVHSKTGSILFDVSECVTESSFAEQRIV